jgi:hypothetical protein
MTATRCRPPTLRDLSTELTFEVADFYSGSFTSILPYPPRDRLDPNLGHGSRGGDHRGGHRTGSHAEASAEALARYYRKGGRR